MNTDSGDRESGTSDMILDNTAYLWGK